MPGKMPEQVDMTEAGRNAAMVTRILSADQVPSQRPPRSQPATDTLPVPHSGQIQ